jgi:glycosyltransferase involved in cell wall biosynthesis
MASIVLTVCTSRRPHGLRRLLVALRDVVAPTGFAAVVVDNDDTAREGVAVCREMGRDYPWPLTCVVEPRRGISHARNCAVATALERSPEFIAMLDDDEWPSRSWLQELTRIQRDFNADIVSGPVVPMPAQPMEHWQALAPYYGLTRDLVDGTACTLYGGGNFLARRRCFEAFDGPFDPAFDQIGGEDLHFFQRLGRLGMRSRWAAKAVVFEDTPPQRLTREWLLLRQLRRGYINVRVQRRLDPSALAEMIRFARSLAVLGRAGLRRLRAGRGAQPDALLAELYWRYALGRLRAHRPGNAITGLPSHGGSSEPGADQ